MDFLDELRLRLTKIHFRLAIYWSHDRISPTLPITADLSIPKGGAEGVVTCAGAFSAGWSLHIKDGKPHFRYTGIEISDIDIAGTVTVPEGKVTLKSEFTSDGSKEGAGTLKLLVNGKLEGEDKIKRTFCRHGLEPFEVGRDSITPVSPDDKSPFAFTEKIEKVTLELIKKKHLLQPAADYE